MSFNKKRQPTEVDHLDSIDNYTIASGILSILEDGEYHTRWELRTTLNVSDRSIRESIERLRLDGELIVSNSQGKGYRLSRDLREIQACIKEFETRAKQNAKIANRMKQSTMNLLGKGVIYYESI